MKFAIYLMALCLTTILTPAYATDVENSDESISMYCTEQAELAGIEDMSEKSLYIKECIESYEQPAEIEIPTE